MAGPTASVILNESLSAANLQAVWEKVCLRATIVEGSHFWVDGRPFSLSFGEEYSGGFEELGYESVIGWSPRDSINITAMCNQQIDHYELAQLAMSLARLHGGLIDFGGDLGVLATSVLGRLWAVPYTGSLGRKCIFHIGDVQFIESWLASPHFRMVK